MGYKGKKYRYYGNYDVIYKRVFERFIGAFIFAYIFINFFSHDTSMTEIQIEDDVRSAPAIQQNLENNYEEPVKKQNSAQSGIYEAQQSVRNVQKQLAREQGYTSNSRPRYIENNENFETTTEPKAQILDEAPSSIIIEPAD